METRAVLYDATLATSILDLVSDIVSNIDDTIQVHFEELTAEPGILPRMMITLLEAGTTSNRYISGEQLISIPFALTLRVAAIDEQDRLDAAALLSKVSREFINNCVSFDNYVAYTRPLSSVPTCLGRTNIFEDWQLTFDLNYKKTN